MGRKIKYTRKDLKGPDEFISTLGRATLWIRENRSRVLVAVAVLMMAAGGVFGTRAYVRWQEAKANRELWPHLNQAREVLQVPSVADQEKLDRLVEFLTVHVNLHPDTGAAVFARYYLGSIAYLRGDYDQSAAQFRSAITSGKEQGTLMDFLLREGLAQALEARGDAESAQKPTGRPPLSRPANFGPRRGWGRREPSPFWDARRRRRAYSARSSSRIPTPLSRS